MGTNSGRKDEGPAHNVTVDTFRISESLVTVAEYRMYCEERGLEMPEPPSWGWQIDHPMVNVSWSDAVNYCIWLSTKLNKKISLPTEAQWEYAARGGKKSKKYKHSGGRKIDQVGWCRVQKIESTKPIKTKKPNELGIYDMNGNVWEWCMDVYDSKYYLESPRENPYNKTKGEKNSRVARGGGWDSESTTCTVTHRKGYLVTSKFDDRGFRVVCAE